MPTLLSGCDSPKKGDDAGTPAACATGTCPLATLIVHVHKDTAAGSPISSAQVEISGPESGANPSDVTGKVVFEKIQPGKYKVKVLKELYVPEPAEQDVDLSPSSTKEVTLVLSLIEYHMHLDADRDGKVDDDRIGLDKWEWGKGKKGAIILCNNDDDEGASKSDNKDDKVNAGNDGDELAPLVFRRMGPAAPPSCEAFLEIDAGEKDKIRIFESRSAGAKEIVGPKAGSKYKFADLNFTEKEFGMEALQYASGGFGGEVMLTFTVKMGGGKSYSEKGKVRVAPWMMPNHLDKAEKVYVVDAGVGNNRFRSDLKTHVTAAGCSFKEHASGDIWMQDCMEFGYSNLPAHGFRSVMRAQRPRPLETFPKTLLAADIGYTEQGNAASMGPKESTFNSTGNLECSPPVTSKAGKKYPLGRIYYGPGRSGEETDADVKSFLAKQVVQKPIEIDTNWLVVGHVDEIISFVPSSGGKGFKLLLASPRLAYKILNDNKATHPTAKLLTGRKFPDIDPLLNVEVTIKDFLDKGLTSLNPKFTNLYLKTYNDTRQLKLDSIRTQLETELGLDASDTIEVPVIFADITVSGLADALTAGMVNMLVINKHCIFPKPFGPVVAGVDLFQDNLEKKLKLQGLTPHPIDDWFEYHVNLGEVHCGTNTLRIPTVAKWWEFDP